MNQRRQYKDGRAIVLSTLLLGMGGCETKDFQVSSGPAVSASVTRDEMDPDVAAKVLARVGERTITLGDYVSSLERMDALERLRYQTPERRLLLLNEMINVELLAREAERRGLDKLPETQSRIRQLMSEDLRRSLRAELPKLKDLPETDVHRYFDAHPEEFAEPERRRVAVIALASEAKARALLEQLNVEPGRFGSLVRGHSLIRPNRFGANNATARPPLELEGDLGVVSASAAEAGSDSAVPEPVRDAVFQLKKRGDIYQKVVKAKGRFYIVRLMSLVKARKRTLAEVDKLIRVRLLDGLLRKAEGALEAELRKKFPIVVNKAVLSKLRIPAAITSPKPTTEAPKLAPSAKAEAQ